MHVVARHEPRLRPTTTPSLSSSSSSSFHPTATATRRVFLWGPLALFYAVSIAVMVWKLHALDVCNRIHRHHGSSSLLLFSSSSATATIPPTPTRPTLLLAIFSTRAETERRQYIRETMLNTTTSTKKDRRLCPLHVYLATNDHEEDTTTSTSSSSSSSCQVLYAFLVGAGPPGSPLKRTQATNLTELLVRLPREYSSSTTTTVVTHEEPVEPDVVQLNIAENMNAGKSPTYFHYGALLHQELLQQQLDNNNNHQNTHPSKHIDYVAKMDSDTLMDFDQLIQFVNDYLAPFDAPQYRPTFGGMMFDWMYCGGHVNKHCNNLKGRVYMSGAFYFMSQHLAQHIVTPAVDQQHFANYEDMDMGMRVATYTQPIAYVEFNTGPFWRHGLKKERDFRKWWKEGVEGNKTEAYWNGWGAWKPSGGGLG